MIQNFKKTLLLIVTMVLSCSVFSQVKFERVFGGTAYDYGYSVIQAADSGYVLAGSTSSFGNGNSDAYIIKTNSLGIAQWQKTIGGINIDQAYSISQTADSGLVIAGYTNSYGNGGYDMYLIRTDINGDTIWTKTYGGTDWDFGYSAQQTVDGGYIIAGSTYSFGNGNQDMFLVKTNSLGDTVWTKTYGGANDDEAKSVKQTPDGGYILTGYTKSFGDINGDMYTVKTDSMGDTLWTKTLGFSGIDKANEIILTADGGYMYSGVSENTVGGYNVSIIVKTTSIGDTTFTRRNGYPNDACANSVCQSNDGGYVWTGKLKIGANYQVYLFKYDGGGNYVFSYVLGSSKNEEAMSIKQTYDLGYIVVGNTNSFNNYLGDIYLFKTDLMGLASGSIVNYATAINDYYNSSNSFFKIYPNPSNEGFTTLLLNAKIINNSNEIKVNIYSSLGQLIATESYNNTSINNNEISINTTKMNNGLYFIEINSGDTKATSKLIVEHN